MQTAGTYSKTLESSSVYLVAIGKQNTSSANSNGLYVITTPASGVSSIRAIETSSYVSDISVNSLTLSITTSGGYCLAGILKLV